MVAAVVARTVFGHSLPDLSFSSPELSPLMRLLRATEMRTHTTAEERSLIIRLVTFALYAEDMPWMRASPLFLPPALRKARQAALEVDAIMLPLIAERRAQLNRATANTEASAEPCSDMLSLLLGARDDAGQLLSEQQICDELRTFLLAGSETTSATLQYALVLCSQNPAVERKLLEELQSVLGPKRTATAEDLAELRYMRAFLQEVLRLYPTVPVMIRQVAAEGWRCRGYVVPPGTSLFLSPYVLQRDPKIWSRPDDCIPERFLTPSEGPSGDASASLLTHMPVGMGPRTCIGRNFALVELQLGLSELLRRFTFAVEGAVVHRARLTLGPADMMLRIQRRLASR
jgi:cytochrome P450